LESRKQNPAEQFIAHLDALAEKLRPRRRPEDRGQSECSPQELRALNVLGHAGPLTMTGLADRLKTPISTATRIVDRLVAQDLVERKRAAQDGRVVQVAFSGRGKRINQFVTRSRTAAARKMLDVLPPRERELLLRGLAKMTKTA
jgi:DNA-binding MarR family transcriptional regulator